MATFSKLKTMVSVSALCAALIGPAQAQGQQTPLEYKRDIYQKFTPDNFDDGGEVSHYAWKNFPAFFPHATIARTKPARALDKVTRDDVAGLQLTLEDGPQTLDAYVNNSPLVDGMIVLSGGTIVYEAYPRMEPYDRHLGWSVTKVIVGAALAALEAQGKIDIDQPVETYVPELRGADWAGISVRNIVNMASGINCLDSDGYQDTTTCVYIYEESLGLTAPHNEPANTIDLIRGMKKYRAAGTKYEYVSADTFVTGLVIEAVTGQPLALALQSLLWDHTGAEADGLMMTGLNGQSAAHAGLSARLRDIARFGEIYTSRDLGVVGPEHLTDLGSSNGIKFGPQQIFALKEQFGDDYPTHAAWQWDMIWPDGAMFKGGYSGQGIYVDPSLDLVIAFYGTADEAGRSNELLSAARQISRSFLSE